MKDARPTTGIGSARPPRAQRGDAGLVAQYIHEISRPAGMHEAPPAARQTLRAPTAAGSPLDSGIAHD
jgi:hypothetical protein